MRGFHEMQSKLVKTIRSTRVTHIDVKESVSTLGNAERKALRAVADKFATEIALRSVGLTQQEISRLRLVRASHQAAG